MHGSKLKSYSQNLSHSQQNRSLQNTLLCTKNKDEEVGAFLQLQYVIELYKKAECLQQTETIIPKDSCNF